MQSGRILDLSSAAESLDPEKRILLRNCCLINDSFDHFDERKAMVAHAGRIQIVDDNQALGVGDFDRVIDLAGGFVLPGFFDAHVHITTPELVNELALFVCNGVLGVRDLGSCAEKTLRLATRIRDGELVGPIIESYGELVDGEAPRWPEITVTPNTEADMLAHVRRCVSLGLAGVKFYHKLPDHLLAVGLAACRNVRLRSSGHLGHIVPVGRAISLGIDSIEHVATLTRDLVAEGQIREEDGFWHYFGPYQAWRDHVDLRSDATSRLIEAFLSSGTVFVPTLAVYNRLAQADREESSDLQYLNWIEETSVHSWNDAIRRVGFSDDHFRMAREAMEKMKEFVRLFYEAGGVLALGTDTPNPFVVPGASFHEEIRLFVEAGIPVSDVLRAACSPPKRVLGDSVNRGRFEPGETGRFIVLGQNPLEDIRATQDVRTVLIAGRRLIDLNLIDGS